MNWGNLPLFLLKQIKNSQDFRKPMVLLEKLSDVTKNLKRGSTILFVSAVLLSTQFLAAMPAKQPLDALDTSSNEEFILMNRQEAAKIGVRDTRRLKVTSTHTLQKIFEQFKPIDEGLWGDLFPYDFIPDVLEPSLAHRIWMDSQSRVPFQNVFRIKFYLYFLPGSPLTLQKIKDIYGAYQPKHPRPQISIYSPSESPGLSFSVIEFSANISQIVDAFVGVGLRRIGTLAVTSSSYSGPVSFFETIIRSGEHKGMRGIRVVFAKTAIPIPRCDVLKATRDKK